MTSASNPAPRWNNKNRRPFLGYSRARPDGASGAPSSRRVARWPNPMSSGPRSFVRANTLVDPPSGANACRACQPVAACSASCPRRRRRRVAALPGGVASQSGGVTATDRLRHLEPVYHPGRVGPAVAAGASSTTCRRVHGDQQEPHGRAGYGGTVRRCPRSSCCDQRRGSVSRAGPVPASSPGVSAVARERNGRHFATRRTGAVPVPRVRGPRRVDPVLVGLAPRRTAGTGPGGSSPATGPGTGFLRLPLPGAARQPAHVGASRRRVDPP